MKTFWLQLVTLWRSYEKTEYYKKQLTLAWPESICKFDSGS